jgi:hypothetical protein
MGSEDEPIVLPDIDARLAKLKSFETDLVNPEVERARQILRRLFDMDISLLRPLGVLTYHGSLQYNDPVNLDVDVDFFLISNLSIHHGFNILEQLGEVLVGSCLWPRKPCDTNMGCSSIDQIKKGLTETGTNPKYETFPELNASLMLSSALLYPDQEPQLRVLQREVRKIIQGHQWLHDNVVLTLDDAIHIREERRRGLSASSACLVG